MGKKVTKRAQAVPKKVKHAVEGKVRSLRDQAMKARDHLDEALLGLTHKALELKKQKIEPSLENGRIQAQSVSELAMEIAGSIAGRTQQLRDTVQAQTMVRKARVTAHRTKRKIRRVLQA